MNIAGLTILNEFGKRHADVGSLLKIWVHEVEEAQWQTPTDIKTRYVHASFLADNRVIFNLKGNKYRLDVKVSYKNKIVFIKRIGTHAEYSKWKF